MAQNTQIRTRLDEILATASSEKEWWEKRKEAIQTEFMKELDEEKKVTADSSTVKSIDDDAVLVEGGGPADKSGKAKKKKGKN
jgi:translocation protein SEC66